MRPTVSQAPKHKTIPIFLAQLGCPHQCTFCNQHTITASDVPTPKQAQAQIAQMLQTVGENCKPTLAFFGGSFTALPKEQMEAYLKIAQPFDFDSIRISTRPDAIDTERLSLLRHYGVTHIELGIQSMDDAVLAACRRGHTADQSRRACAQIVEGGFTLGGQMMIGLPASTAKSECQTAQEICALGAKEARIYPLCVFADTPLFSQMQRGEFSPISQAQAVTRSADALEILLSHGVKVLRIGLCANEGLEHGQVQNGYHSSFGELVYSALYQKAIFTQLKSYPPSELAGATVSVQVAPHAVSRAIGQAQCNRISFCQQFSLHRFLVVPCADYVGFDCTVSVTAPT